jgi:hypothetical protein
MAQTGKTDDKSKKYPKWLDDARWLASFSEDVIKAYGITGVELDSCGVERRLADHELDPFIHFDFDFVKEIIGKPIIVNKYESTDDDKRFEKAIVCYAKKQNQLFIVHYKSHVLKEGTFAVEHVVEEVALADRFTYVEKDGKNVITPKHEKFNHMLSVYY